MAILKRKVRGFYRRHDGFKARSDTPLSSSLRGLIAAKRRMSAHKEAILVASLLTEGVGREEIVGLCSTRALFLLGRKSNPLKPVYRQVKGEALKRRFELRQNWRLANRKPVTFERLPVITVDYKGRIVVSYRIVAVKED